MARRRRVDHAGVDRFTDERVEAWLTDADRAAVEAAGTSPAALAAVTGGLHDEMRFTTIPVERRQGWAVSSLAAGHRCRAIAAWAQVNNIPAGQALAYFIGEPEVASP